VLSVGLDGPESRPKPPIMAPYLAAANSVAGAKGRSRAGCQFTSLAGSGCDSGRFCGRQWKTPHRRVTASTGVRPRLASNTAGSGRGPSYLARAKALSAGLPMRTSNRSGSRHCSKKCRRNLLEPPCTHPYARWCGRGRRVTAAPMRIKWAHRKVTLPSLGRKTGCFPSGPDGRRLHASGPLCNAIRRLLEDGLTEGTRGTGESRARGQGKQPTPITLVCSR
jgi:hypothetical protein